jgi:hypothetical protein
VIFRYRKKAEKVTQQRWLDGESDPPTPIFLKTVDIVMERPG